MGGLVLVSVVAYALMLGGGFSTSSADGSAQVVVFYPDSNSWRTFRRGLQACQERGLLRVVGEGGDWILVRSTDQGRKVRFCWDAALGERELRQHLNDRLNAPNRPVAVVGSINTTLTLALARELAAWSRSHETPGPALLVTGGHLRRGGAVALDWSAGRADSRVSAAAGRLPRAHLPVLPEQPPAGVPGDRLPE